MPCTIDSGRLDSSIVYTLSKTQLLDCQQEVEVKNMLALFCPPSIGSLRAPGLILNQPCGRVNAPTLLLHTPSLSYFTSTYSLVLG